MDFLWSRINHPLFPYWDNNIRNPFLLQVTQLMRPYITICMWYNQNNLKKVSYCSMLPLYSKFIHELCMDSFIPLLRHFVSIHQYWSRDIPLLSHSCMFRHLVFHVSLFSLFILILIILFHYKYVLEQSNNGMHYSR